ncbi:MAG: D-alanyl-D-alanine carboxypeptidase, partial [Bryobacteraceae bacterium]
MSAVLLAQLRLNAAESADVSAAVSKLLAQSASVLQHGRVGYAFIDLQSGSLLAAKDADFNFVPASNMKLYTTALALARLGSGYQMRTELRTSGGFEAGQKSIPDLSLIGGGDPNLSGRPVPYRVDVQDSDPLKGLRELADDLYAAGVREIAGDVTGMAARYGTDLYPDGWTIDDSSYDYGAPVSALTLNDNSVSVMLRPTGPGELADL